jgi:hypothetical protein
MSPNKPSFTTTGFRYLKYKKGQAGKGERLGAFPFFYAFKPGKLRFFIQ